MTGEEFIELASRLLLSNIGHEEARYRSAVSRAYYGAFHLAISFLGGVGVTVLRNHGSHEEAYRRLINSGDSEAKHAARLLNDLRAARNKADYALEDPRFSRIENAKADIEVAAKFRQKIGACNQEIKSPEDHKSETQWQRNSRTVLATVCSAKEEQPGIYPRYLGPGASPGRRTSVVR